jgi:hypothetical protein
MTLDDHLIRVAADEAADDLIRKLRVYLDLETHREMITHRTKLLLRELASQNLGSRAAPDAAKALLTATKAFAEQAQESYPRLVTTAVLGGFDCKYLSGYGMIQIRVARDVRLQIYVNKVTKTPIHDHRADLESLVLYGVVREVQYHPETMVEVEHREVPAGERYFIRGDVPHRIIIDPLTITLVTEIWREGVPPRSTTIYERGVL